MKKKKPAEEPKYFTTRLGPSTHIAIKRRAIDEGRSVQHIVTDALLDYLSKPLSTATR